MVFHCVAMWTLNGSVVQRFREHGWAVTQWHRVTCMYDAKASGSVPTVFLPTPGTTLK